jgi:hypothetical protein
MRTSPVLLALSLLLVPSLTLAARTADNRALDLQTISEMESRAQQAEPRNQCFLYTELVHDMTEVAAQQLDAGQSDQAAVTLRKIQHYADLIAVNLANNTRKLKNSELLMARTTQRLNNILHAASPDDRPVIQYTLKRLNRVQTQLLMAVFRQ